MSNRLIFASAGAGKSNLIANEALEKSRTRQKVLILTYTKENQKELYKKICQLNHFKPREVAIKGWFTFLLEDLIRPYQRCIFSNRIPNIHFNKNGDPHKRNGRNIPGTAEIVNRNFNPIHYLTRVNGKAHTTYISKLATRIINKSQHKSIERLASIYDAIFIDEVQDLVGWDFDIIESISRLVDISLTCVGDFRQTVYATHLTTKRPRTILEKKGRFQAIGFQPEYMNVSWRCIQSICDFAQLVHADQQLYPVTVSNVHRVPDDYESHTGVFTVSEQNIHAYIEKYQPIILRVNKSIRNDICINQVCYNFRLSKGLGFNRVLIIPTENHRRFLRGETDPFRGATSESPKNILYVICTRARYSIAFLFDEDSALDNIRAWQP